MGALWGHFSRRQADGCAGELAWPLKVTLMVGQAAAASSKGGVRTGFQSGSTALQNLHATSSLHQHGVLKACLSRLTAGVNREIGAFKTPCRLSKQQGKTPSPQSKLPTKTNCVVIS